MAPIKRTKSRRSSGGNLATISSLFPTQRQSLTTLSTSWRCVENGGLYVYIIVMCRQLHEVVGLKSAYKCEEITFRTVHECRPAIQIAAVPLTGQSTWAASPPVGCYMGYIHNRHFIITQLESWYSDNRRSPAPRESKASPPFGWYQIILFGDRGWWCVNNLPRVVTRKWNCQELKPQPLQLQHINFCCYLRGPCSATGLRLEWSALQGSACSEWPPSPPVESEHVEPV